MDFDPRDHDARDREGRDSHDPRDAFMRDLDLPRSAEREIVRDRDHEYNLRGSETRTLSTVGAFRVRLLYRRWLTDGEPALDVAVSPAIRDALAGGMGQIQCQVLPASYRHLSPLASLVRPRLRGVEEGEQTLARPQPPQPERDDDHPAGCARDWRRLMDAR